MRPHTDLWCGETPHFEELKNKFNYHQSCLKWPQTWKKYYLSILLLGDRMTNNVCCHTLSTMFTIQIKNSHNKKCRSDSPLCHLLTETVASTKRISQNVDNKNWTVGLVPPDYDRAVPQLEMTCQLNIIFKTWKYYLWGLCTVCVQLYSAGVVYTCTGVIAVTRLSVYERLWSETHHVSVVKVKIKEKNSFTVSQRKYQLYQWHLNISKQFYDLLWNKIMCFW